MSNPNVFLADAKREEYRKYLEKNGVLDALTKSLTSMYSEPDKPSDPLIYLTGRLVKAQTGQPTIDALLSELNEVKAENVRYRNEIDELKAKLASKNQNG